MSKLDEKGNEIPDPTPVSIPVQLRRQESMDERIRRIIQHSASMHAQSLGLESFEEADDFDIEDDPIDPSTPWEKHFDQAIVQAVDAGLVKPPHLDPERYRELKDRYFRKRGIVPAKQEPAQAGSGAPAPQGTGAGAPAAPQGSSNGSGDAVKS